MLRNYLAVAIRNLFRNRAYAALNIFGLALAFAAAILIALFVRDEYSYDRFFPNYERVYRVLATVRFPGQAPLRIGVTSSNIAAALKLDFPEVEETTRLSGSRVTVRHGDVEVSKMVYWADPNFFRFFPLRTLAGNLADALQKPDEIVLTRASALTFFGRADVVGETLEINRQHVMRVVAVLADLPSNTHLSVDVFGAALATFSETSVLDAVNAGPGVIRRENVYTYIRLRPEASVTRLDAEMPGFVARHMPSEVAGISVAKLYRFSFTPLADIHLQPRSLADMKPQGDPRTLQAMIGIAALILFVAASNFVSMMTARAARRAVEVGVRKTVGATRLQIIVQFLGECLFYTALALIIAVIAVELILPAFNGFLQRGIEFDYLRDPTLGAAIVAITLLTGIAASIYPALVLSMFRPNVVLKGSVNLPGGSARLRQALVIFQFGTLIALIVATLTIHRQTQYAMEERLRLPSDQIYVGRAGCPPAFIEAAARLPGVHFASCSSGSALTMDRFASAFSSPRGTEVSFRIAPVDAGFLDLFSIKPVAGRLFAQNRGEDEVLRTDPNSTTNPSIVINEAGARALGFASPAAAVDQSTYWTRMIRKDKELSFTPKLRSQIIGVIPDFSVGSVRDVIEPTAYYVDPSMLYLMVLNLDGKAIPETMSAVKSLWAKHADAPLEGVFLSQYVNDLYSDILRQATLFAVFAAVAVVIAALGLLGLAVFTAERRTREIGLRKIMGASRVDILRFLAWQFTRPVLWANLMAWPLAYFFMQHWLEGFAYHINLNPLLFIGASTLALMIALATVSGHALLVARARPVEALRYE